MSDPIHIFSIPLGPAQPGLTPNQIVRRKGEAYRIVRASDAIIETSNLLNVPGADCQ